MKSRIRVMAAVLSIGVLSSGVAARQTPSSSAGTLPDAKDIVAKFVAAIGGGCLAPVAAYHDGARLRALIAAEDGSWIESGSGDDPAALAERLAERVAARDEAGTEPARTRA